MKRRLNQIKESAVHAYKALRTNVMRTILSLLGVTTGIFCIISVSALVDSIDRSVQETFSVISDDMIFIQKMPMMPDESGEYKWWEYMRRKNITQKQASMLRERMNLAHAVSYQIGTMETVEHLNSFASNVQVAGVSYEYNQAIEVDIGDGRYFTQMESQSGKSVALVGSNVAEKLFGEGVSSVGKEIKVGGYKMTVIGQFAKAGNNLLPGGFDDAVMVPAKFSSKFVDPKYAETSVVIKAKDGVSTDELKEEAINTLRPIRKLKPKKENDFAVIEATFFSEILDGIFSMVRGAGIAIGFCALLVGGFGIMNIMFVSVKERTKQIGIQKSLGATRAYILYQFLFESVFLCVIGGIFGLLLIGLIFLIVNSFLEFTFVLSTRNIIVGIFVSVLIGLASGFIPSYKASKLNPVDAMRSK